MIPVAKPWLDDKEVAAVSEVLRSGWVTQGPKVQEFEQQFASYVGARHACAVSSCTAALHLALLGVGVMPGDVVLTVSHSFIATANSIRHCGAEPVFIDIEPDTFNIDPDLLEQCLSEECEERNGLFYYRDVKRLAVGESPLCHCNKPTGRVAAILAVHQMGMPCDLERVLGVAGRYSLPVVEDAACAIGSEITLDHGKTWEKIGRPHGDVACFSFHPRKILTTGDGGMLTTNSDELDEKFRLWRQHGMSVPDTVRHGATNVIFEKYVTTGFNYRMTDIQAAVGIVQLGKMAEHLKKRREFAARYKQMLTGNHVCLPPSDPDVVRTNWQSFPVRLKLGFEQKKIMQLLLDNNIASRQGIMNAHEEAPYRHAEWQLPESEKARQETMLLPLYPQMFDSEHECVVSLLNQVI